MSTEPPPVSLAAIPPRPVMMSPALVSTVTPPPSEKAATAKPPAVVTLPVVTLTAPAPVSRARMPSILAVTVPLLLSMLRPPPDEVARMPVSAVVLRFVGVVPSPMMMVRSSTAASILPTGVGETHRMVLPAARGFGETVHSAGTTCAAAGAEIANAITLAAAVRGMTLFLNNESATANTEAPNVSASHPASTRPISGE